MTKIKMLNDRIIFDGHADSRQECETITLMCDNLAKSKDFKTIRYESGYAEFEKVGKAEELKFPPPAEPTFMTVNFDSHVIKVEATNEFADTYTWTTSGQELSVVGNGGTIYYATVTLEDGYEIDTVTGGDYNLLTFSGNEISFRTDSFGMGSGFTITTKVAATKQTIDVSTLSGWANLATGNHQITIKTKASGYVDSAASNAVTVSKAASGYKLTIINNSEAHGFKPSYITNVGSGEFENEVETKVINGVTSISSFVVNQVTMNPLAVCKVVSDELNISLSEPLTAKGSTLTVISTTTMLTQDTTITVSQDSAIS